MRLVLCLLVLLLPGLARADTAFWSAARAEGTHLLMRHARAPGTGDPSGFRLGDCSTQRNLDAEGRAQAAAIGQALRKAGVSVDRVLSSAWCRAKETARLLDLGAVEPEPALDSFFEDRQRRDAQTEALRARLADLAEDKAVLVTHQVNITALTGVYPASGEIVLVSIEPDTGEVVVRGRLVPSP